MFRNDFKYYKRNCPPPDLSDVVDFSRNSVQNTIMHKTSTCKDVEEERMFGLRAPGEWKIYELLNKSGLLFIPNPFTTLGQRYWVCRCLRDFTCKPQKLNLDAHGDLKEGEKWWEICMKGNDRSKILLQKLRWATLGYHHNWDTKVYNENSHDPFPEDLAKLSQYVAKVVGFKDFSAEAAIVNYYHMDSTLSGHTDHSEKNKEAPLFSFSFGQSAIFLIGGPSLEEKPIALLIDSGDIIIMSGGSRLCYHGIPRILPTNKAPWSFLQQEEYEHDGYNDCSVLENVKDGVKGEVKHSREELSHCVDNELWEPYGTYLKTSRINMNVRQVLQPGEKFLPH